MRRPARSVALVAGLLALGGCSLEPSLTVPRGDVRGAYRDGGHDVASLANVEWFDLYGDEVLRGLIRRSIEGSPDLAGALARIDEARAIAKATGADLHPQVDFGAGAGAARASRFSTPVGDRDTGYWNARFDLRWEIDLFGRIRSEQNAARSRYFASVEAHRDVGIRLVSEVARAYFELRALDDLLVVTERNLRSAAEYVDLAKTRFEGGKTSEIDYRQSEGEYFRTESVRVDTLRQIASKENEISVLIGRAPDAVPRGRRAEEQPMPATVPAGLPSDLLQRRPDIRGAEQVLAAETSLVGSARANLYPRIALTGNLGWESDALSDLFQSSASTASLIAGLLQPILDGGRNRAIVEARCARMRLAMEAYRSTVLTAFGEVEDGLVGVRRFTEQRRIQDRRVGALTKVLDLAVIRYRGGVSEYLEVLDAQRELFDAEIERTETVRDQLVSLTLLYKALGGGWDPAFGVECCPPCKRVVPPTHPAPASSRPVTARPTYVAPPAAPAAPAAALPPTGAGNPPTTTSVSPAATGTGATSTGSTPTSGGSAATSTGVPPAPPVAPSPAPPPPSGAPEAPPR